MDNNIQTIKQPTPSTMDNKNNAVRQATKTKREIKRPYVGVIQAPKTSRAPISDMIILKQQENPYTVYKITPESYKKSSFQMISSLGIFICGSIALIKNLKLK